MMNLIRRWKMKLMPVLLALIGLLLLVWYLPAAVRGQPKDTEVKSDGQTQLDQLSRQREALKDRLDSISHDAGTAQWLLSMVLAAAGLLTLAQGGLAFIAARNYEKQADDAINRAKEAVAKAEGKVQEAEGKVQEANKKMDAAVASLETLAIEVRLKYPMFAELESARSEAFNELGSLWAGLDTDENLYAKAGASMRQRIYAAEGFSAVQFLSPVTRGQQLLNYLRSLGRFYAGRYTEEGRSKADLERAQYYYDVAFEKFGRPFTVLNDLGWLYSAVVKPADNQRAQDFFEESFRRRPTQQRAPYGLGTILCERADRIKLEKAKEYLLRAASEQNWEEAPNPRLASNIYYNLACACDGLAGYETELSKQGVLLDECVVQLKVAAVVGSQSQSQVDDDLKNGDLRNLSGSTAHAAKLKEILDAYQLAWQRAGGH